jgi:hypothetical protein
MSKTGKIELIRVLQERKLWTMLQRAKDGHYSDFGSPYPSPIIELVAQLEAAGHHDLAERAKNGDFDHER